MGKVALMFPGQGAQYVGMGKDLYDNYQSVRDVFNTANEVLEYDLAKLCFNGPDDQLQLTKITQPAMLTVGFAIAKVLKDSGVEVDTYCGLSLGEYGALVMANALEFKQAVKLVEKRGKFMQEAVPVGIGSMAAIIGLDNESVEEICKIASSEGIVEISNYNCPGQIVIGGEVKAVEYASKLANEQGALKVISLQVSAPFHTSMLKGAKERLNEELEKIEFSDTNTSVISSVTAKYIDDKSQIQGILANQVCSSVMWEQVIKRLIEDDHDTFIAIGPGKSLRGFVSRVSKKVNVITIEDLKTLQKGLERLLN
ncbi:MAG: ACP S-malonyltransferase [Clostridia bacterium]